MEQSALRCRGVVGLVFWDEVEVIRSLAEDHLADFQPVRDQGTPHEGFQVIAADEGGDAVNHLLGHLEERNRDISVQKRHPFQHKAPGLVDTLGI